MGVEFLAALLGPLAFGIGSCFAAEFSGAGAEAFAGGNTASVPIAAAECSGNPDLGIAVAAGGRLIGGVPCWTFPKICKTGGSAFGAVGIAATGHRQGHSSSWVVAQTMQAGSHSLEAVHFPSILAIVLRPSVHSIQPDAGQEHAYVLIGAKTESVSSSGCALPSASIPSKAPFPLQSYRSQGSIPCQLNSAVVEVDWPWL